MGRVLLLGNGSNVDVALAAALRQYGCDVELTLRRGLPPDEERATAAGFDLVLAFGPAAGSMLPAARLVSRSIGPTGRPLFAWWLVENLPDPRVPRWLVDSAAHVRVAAEEWWAARPQLRASRGADVFSRLHRLRILGELYRVRSLGVLDLLPVAGLGRTEYLRDRGFQAFPVFFGYCREFGTDLGGERDIDVVFLAQPGSRRRRSLLRRLEAELARRKVRLEVYDGVWRSLRDEERTRLLNRCKILLNLLKAPHDAVAYRLLLGAANKALVVSEPLQEYSGFEPGRHLVTAAVGELADTIEFFLAHEKERRAICEEAYRFVTEELTLERMVGSILERCDDLRRPERAVSRAAS